MAINKLNLNGIVYDIGEAEGTNTAESIVEFSSADQSDPSSADESVELLKSGDTHQSLWEKMSAGMKNIRWMLKNKADAIALTDGSVTKVGTSSVGNASRPMYLSSGTPTACSSTVGGTDTPVYMSSGTITVCGTSFSSKADATALTDGSVTKVGTSDVGSSSRPIYLKLGIPTECDDIKSQWESI